MRCCPVDSRCFAQLGDLLATTMQFWWFVQYRHLAPHRLCADFRPEAQRAVKYRRVGKGLGLAGSGNGYQEREPVVGCTAPTVAQKVCLRINPIILRCPGLARQLHSRSGKRLQPARNPTGRLELLRCASSARPTNFRLFGRSAEAVSANSLAIRVNNHLTVFLEQRTRWQSVE
jgi:hypothetical protein